MEAILLVGGQGTRLRPLTIHTPKPMLPVAGVPFTAHQIARARDAGVTRIVLGTSYKAEVFSDYFGDGSQFGVELVCRTEQEPLGTGGAIRYAAEALTCGPDDPVLVFNGDVLSGVDLRHLVQRHTDTGASVTLHLTRVADPRAFGLVPTDSDDRVLQFREKPASAAEIVTDQINAGCYVFRRSIIEQIPAGRVVSVERETFPSLLARGDRLTGVVDPGYWLDLGTPLSFVQGSRDLVLGTISSSAVAPHGPGALVAASATVDSQAIVEGGSAVGDNARVGPGARVSGSVLMAGVSVGEDAEVVDSVVATGAVIRPAARLVGAVVGERSVVGAGVELLEGARVWPDAELPDGSLRFSSDR
jgi:mannose-1-phosphate guanylyltransferase